MSDELIFSTIDQYFKERKLFALCTIVRSVGSTPRHLGSKMLVTPDGKLVGSVGGGELEHRVIDKALECLSTSGSATLEYKLDDLKKGDPGVCGGQVEIFVETIKLPEQFVIVGGGHVGKALTHLAKWLGFYVILSDDRPEFCDPTNVPGADKYVQCSLGELSQKIKIDPATYVILTTRGVGIDVPGLPDLLATSAKYIGIIGSKRRWITTRNELIQNGVDQTLIERVNSPIGIDIGAETPEEIAISIMSEVMMYKKDKNGKSMRLSM